MPMQNWRLGSWPEAEQVSGQAIAPETCFACSRQRAQPACDFTPAILRALYSSMQADPALLAVRSLAEQAGVTLLRVSSLTGCTRQAWYRIKQRPPLEKPARHWARLRGTIFHRALQSMAGKDIVAERRFVVSLQPHGVDAWIAGQVDHFDPDTGILTDLKTINTYGRRLAKLDLPKEHQRAQLWIYAWLLEQSGRPYPSHGQLVYIDMGAVRTVDVPMPAPEQKTQVAQRLLEKARHIVEADENGPPGDPREAWVCRYCAHKQACPDRDNIQPNGNGVKKNGKELKD
jgi:CRISPR/Cas system-associated exonuclease Cas4 (RecB family)